MSTDLYGVRVLEVAPDECRLRLRVFVVYYDTHYESHQPIPDDRSFFVRVLCDKDALGDDIAYDDRFDEAYIDRNAFRFVARLEELERRNFPVESYEGYADFYYERGGGWQDEEKLVQADFDVFVTKPEYLAPFAEGMSWGTTSYPTEADALTEDEYLDIPDFGDVTSVAPFPDGEGEATTVCTMSFSEDGQYLLAGHNEGGFRVFSTDDWSVVTDVPKAGNWLFQPGWTHDGRVAGATDGGYVAYDLETGEGESFEPYGFSANSAGTRLVNGPHFDSAQILDEQGEVLFEMDKPFDHMVYAGFDATGDRCALVIEGEPLRLVDLETNEVSELDHTGINSVALSPDGRYILASTYQEIMVLRAETGEAIRSQKSRGRYPTGVAWSPDEKLAATTLTDQQGYHSKIMLHRLGRDVLASQNAPLEVPARSERDITDLAALYVERTSDFIPGWNSHIDDDLLDFHVALVRMGEVLDLVPQMNSEHTKIAARAYEAIFAHQQDEEERAKAALEDATTWLERTELAEWQQTFVYAPIAAAQFRLGNSELADASLELARDGIDNEANPFQKRSVLARAMLVMGRVDEVRELVDAEDGSWISQFHQRLLSDLVDAGEFALFEHVYEAWNIADDWSARRDVRELLLESDAARDAGLPERLGFDSSEAEEVGDGGLDGLEGEERIEWLGAQGRWEEVYEQLQATKRTLRAPLYKRVADVALSRGDIDIMLDALAKLQCTDMNSPGLRALQKAFKKMAKPHYRVLHP